MPEDPRDDEFQVGDVIAERYVLEEALAKGGFSQVYRARQMTTDKLVAIIRAGKRVRYQRLGACCVQIIRFQQIHILFPSRSS